MKRSRLVLSLALVTGVVVACSPVSDATKPSPSASPLATATAPDPTSSPLPAPSLSNPTMTPAEPTTSPDQTTSPSAEPTPSVEPQSAWTSYTEPFAGPRAQTVDGLFELDDGSLVAWGMDQEDEPGGYASVSFWISPDWRNWSETKVEGLGPFIRVWDVANGPKGIVAAGAREDLGSVWWSTDAKNWTLSSLIKDDYEWSNVQAVAAGPEGFLVVGQHRRHAAAWFSQDGVKWNAVGADALPNGQLYDASTLADGSFVVVGIDDANPNHDGIVRLVSADGTEWHLPKLAGGIATNEDDSIFRVWPYSGGFVGFGYQEDAARRHVCDRVGGECFGEYWPRLYKSTDGLTWTGIGSDDSIAPALASQSGPRLWEFNAVVPFGEGLLAAGAGTDVKPRLWTSSDGVTWDPIGDPILIAGHEAPPVYQADTINDLIIANDRVVIGGELSGSDGYVMIAPLGSI